MRPLANLYPYRQYTTSPTTKDKMAIVKSRSATVSELTLQAKPGQEMESCKNSLEKSVTEMPNTSSECDKCQDMPIFDQLWHQPCFSYLYF